MVMKKVRKNVFETNSSSSHSLSINSDVLDDTIYPNGSNENCSDCIILFGDEFGWGYNKFIDALTKANYCAVDQYLQGNDDNLEMLKEVIEEYTGYPVSINLNDDDIELDHQSIGTSDILFMSKDSLKEFIFCSDNILIIDNDND